MKFDKKVHPMLLNSKKYLTLAPDFNNKPE